MMVVAQDRCAPTSYVPQGLPGLFHHDQEKVRLGNLLLELSVLLYKAASAKGIPVYLENPFSSRAWLMPSMTAMYRDCKCTDFVVDYCQYCMPWKKRITFRVANFQASSIVQRQCTGRGGRCSASGKKHIILQGQDSQGVFWTLRAQPYPMQLCERLAQAFVDEWRNRQL